MSWLSLQLKGNSSASANTSSSPKGSQSPNSDDDDALLVVYVAIYSYDPLQYSPNDQPESELALNVGDYIFVYGDMDEVRRGQFFVYFCISRFVQLSTTGCTNDRFAWMYSKY